MWTLPTNYLLLALPAMALASSTDQGVCQDDPVFRFQGVEAYDCDWLGVQNDGVCNWKIRNEVDADSESHTIGQVYCPVSCGYCEHEVFETTVFASHVCYEQFQGATVSFENEFPQDGDWLAIYPASLYLKEGAILEDNGVGWAWLCAPNSDGHNHEHSTPCKAKYNSVLFPQLPPGIYKAVLSRKDDQVFAQSVAFEVVHSGQSCTQRHRVLTHFGEPKEYCQPHIRVDQSSFDMGEDISIQLEEVCDQSESSTGADAFVAIYPADTDLADIKGDANYLLWMWLCGTQLCHTGGAVKSLMFGSYYNPHSWPLPPGSYQVHLVKKHRRAFYSAAATSTFTVKESSMDVVDKRQLETAKCVDMIKSAAPCYKMGEDLSILIENNCGQLSEEDWLGFYDEKDCAGNSCVGEPLVWSWGCQDTGCDRAKSKYRFYDEGEILLQAGTYRIVLVSKEVDQQAQEGGPYEVRLKSDPIEIHAEGATCQLIRQQT